MTVAVSELPEIDIFSAEYAEDPDAVVAEAREGFGLARTARGVDVLSYEALSELMRDSRMGGSMTARLNNSGIYEGPAFDLVSGNMANLEGDLHNRQRKAAAPWFKPQQAETMRGFVRTWVDERLDEHLDGDGFEFRSAVTRPLPPALFAKIIGAPEADGAVLRDFAETILLLVQGSHPEAQKDIEQASVELGDYVHKLVAAKRENLGDDLVSTLLEAEGRGEVSVEEIVYVLFTVVIGSMDTTDAQICSNLVSLADNQDQWRLLKANPDLLPFAVQELVRYNIAPMTPTVKRVNEPLDFMGIELTPDVEAWGCIFAANKDPKVFDDPRKLDFERKWTRPPLSFGVGIHSCLGRVFAILEMEEVLKSALERWEEFEVDAEWRWSPNLQVAQRIDVKFARA
jgi:cytochrome P450